MSVTFDDFMNGKPMPLSAEMKESLERVKGRSAMDGETEAGTAIDVGFHIDSLVEDCMWRVSLLKETPGQAHAESIIDLYQVVAKLARIVKAAEAQRR